MLRLFQEMEDHPVRSMSNYDFLSQNGYQMKQLGHRISDHDSPSSQSGHSHQEASGMSDSNLNGQHTSTQSENGDSQGKRDQDMMKSVLSLGNPEAAFSAAKLDYNQSFACIPFAYADQCYGGVLTGYPSHTVVYPQLNATANSRVPLPVEPAAEEPIFVNTKQYHAILRRRQTRAKLEAQNRLVKARRPYLHESRHLHAMKRARGSGGRFLNMKQLQEEGQQKQQQLPPRWPPAGAGGTNVLGKGLCLETGTTCSPSTPTSSDVTTVSTSGGGMPAHQEHISFSSAGFLPCISFSTQNGGEKLVPNGVRRHVPIMQ